MQIYLSDPRFLALSQFDQTQNTKSTKTKDSTTQIENTSSQTSSQDNNQNIGQEKLWQSNNMSLLMRNQLQAKLEQSSPRNTPSNDSSSSTNSPSASGVQVELNAVKNVLQEDKNGSLAPNQRINVTYQAGSDGQNTPLSANQLTERSQRDKALQLTDEKGQLTSLGKDLKATKGDGAAIITEPGTNLYQLVKVINGKEPTKEQAETIIAGLIDKGLVSYQVKDGKVSLSVVPYKVASFKDLVSSGQQAQANYERLKAISPGLRQIEGVGVTAAGAYAAAVVAVAAAPLGPFLAGGVSSVAGQTTETVLKDGKLPTKEEAAFSFLLGGTVGKLADNIVREKEIIEIGLSKSTQARQEAASAVAPVIETIFDNKVPSTKIPPAVTPSNTQIQPTNVNANTNVPNVVTTQQTPVTKATTTTATTEATATQTNQQQAVSQKFQELATQGHGPQRHGPAITEQQLDDRAIRGFDPVTGTTDDAYNKLPNGNPATHSYGKNATKVTSEEAYVKAEEHIKNSQEFKDAVAAADAAGKDQIPAITPKLEDIYGPNYRNEVFGKTRTGSAKNPTGSVETDFTDGTMKGVYRKGIDGNWNLHTMYPEPKK
jgi:hypothetical protein